MADNLNALTKWRIDQFRINNMPNKSPEKDFVCLSPKAYRAKDDDSGVIFLSDEDSNEETVPVKSNKLIVVKRTARKEGRNKKAKIEYATISDDSDEDFVVGKRKKRKVTKRVNNATKPLLRKPFTSTKKTAVVAPITKPVESVASTLLDDSKSDTPKPDADNKDNGVASPVSKKGRTLADSSSNICKLGDSDSDLALFEVSFNNDLHNGVSSKERVITNPPPSPVDATTHSVQCNEDVHFNGFSTDSSSDNNSKKRASKGKQPANKKRKVVTKSSKRVLDQSPAKSQPTVADDSLLSAVKDVVEADSMVQVKKATNAPPVSPVLPFRLTKDSFRDKTVKYHILLLLFVSVAKISHV